MLLEDYFITIGVFFILSGLMFGLYNGIKVIFYKEKE